MKFQDLVKLYEHKKAKYGVETFKHVSDLLKEEKNFIKKIGKNLQLRIRTTNNFGILLKTKNWRN